MQLTLLDPDHPEQDFPRLENALRDPDGLLALGGCLSATRLLNAYRHGIFPWFNEGDPILWWSPDPRLVLFPDNLVISRSLRKALRKNKLSVSYDRAFGGVMEGCAAARKGSSGTWISGEIKAAYHELHRLGFAHSAEAWHEGKLVGGLYGVALGRVFFGESMFHTMTDASKIVFVTLVQALQSWGYRLIDCQVHTRHLESFGAQEIDREEFMRLLDLYCDAPVNPDAWSRE
ncbi:MAG: leucyl/phenylalanyl-tRNA--protein transferase [Gammaproteobacteria bacterium]